MRRKTLVLIVWLCTGVVGIAQTRIEPSREIQQLDRLKKQFVDEKGRARNLMSKKFDQMIVDLTNSKAIQDQEKLGRVAKWREEKATFLEKDEIPVSADLAELELDYGMRIVDAYIPLSKKYNDLMKQALVKKDQLVLDALTADKKAFDDLHLPGRREFLEKSVWDGTVYGPAKSTAYRLRVTDVSREAFNGIGEWDTPATGHPMYEVLGALDGIHLSGRYNKPLRGGAFNLSMDGVVLGRTIVMRCSFVGAKGKPISELVVLRKSGQ